MENKRVHLEMIQAIVNRMSQNSFLLKGWTVILASALLALGASDVDPVFVYLAYFPAIVFWALDGYFLWQERLFRALYDHVRELDESAVDFSMNCSGVAARVRPWSDVIFSKTLLAFHGTVVVTIIAVMVTVLVTNGD